jgi:hypothetical protein
MSNPQRAGSKQANQTNDDQVDGDDIVQKTWDQQDQNTCDQRHDRTNVHVKIHGYFLDIYGLKVPQLPEAGLHEQVNRYSEQSS